MRTSTDLELPTRVAVPVIYVAGDVFGMQAELEELVAGRVEAPGVHASIASDGVLPV